MIDVLDLVVTLIDDGMEVTDAIDLVSRLVVSRELKVEEEG